MDKPKLFEVRKYDEEKGLGLYALKHLNENDLIFEEKPLVSAQFAWNKEYKYLACNHCLRPLESSQENFSRLAQNKNILIPYPDQCPTDKSSHQQCTDCGAKYCSNECKLSASQQYHQMLCNFKEPLSTLYSAWMNIHFPPETTSIELLLRIMATIEQSPNKEAAFAELMQFTHGTSNEHIDSALKLLGADFATHLQQIQQILAHALPMTITSALVTEEGLKSFFSLIGRNGQGIGTSVFSEWVKRVTDLDLPSQEKEHLDKFIDFAYEEMDKVVGTFLNCEGSGLYRLQRCLNHSCCPNARVTFPRSDHTLSLVAIQNIEPGEEITISYLDECDLSRSRHSRNKTLREYYLFNCRCNKCLYSMDEPDVTSDDDDDSE